MNNLSQEEITRLKVQLVDRKREIELAREQRLDFMKNDKESLKDSADMAAYEETAERLWWLLGREGQLERKINEAMSRIDEGNFGHCVDCDDMIPYKRLLFDPTLELCIQCKSERELEEGIAS